MIKLSILDKTDDTDSRSLDARLVQCEPLGHSGTPYMTMLNFLSLLLLLLGDPLWAVCTAVGTDWEMFRVAFICDFGHYLEI